MKSKAGCNVLGLLVGGMRMRQARRGRLGQVFWEDGLAGARAVCLLEISVG